MSTSHDKQDGSIASALAAYTKTLRFEDIDPVTLESAKTLLVDSIGCAIAAHESPTVRKCRALVPSFPGPCTVIGTGQRTTMDMAAFVNGAAIRYLDMNDTYMGPGDPGHPSDMLSACLSVGEARGASGRDVLLAMVIAYEVCCRLLDGSRLIANGWDYTLQTLPATALAAGKLMGLDADAMAQAVNIALIAHIPTFQSRAQHLSDWKGLANAQATRDAVFSAMLAEQGITGPAPIFEGTFGMFKQLGGTYEVDVDEFGGRNGQFRINNTSIKAYSSEWFALTAIGAAIELSPQIGDLDNIEQIRVDTTARGVKFLGAEPEKWNPKTREAADHSMPYIVARALIDRAITADSYYPDRIADPRLQRLMPKVTVHEDPEFTAMFPAKTPNRLTVRLAGGRVLEKQLDDLPGFAGRMMNRAEVQEKFDTNVAKYWSKEQSSKVLASIWDLENANDVTQLVSSLLIR